MSWLVLAVAALAFALALLPTRRLYLAGWRPAPLAAYMTVLMALAIAVVLFRAGIRILVPILLVLYILPFVGAPEVLARTITRLGAGRGGRGARAVIEGVARPADGGSGTPTGGPAAGTASQDGADPAPGTASQKGADPAPGTASQNGADPAPGTASRNGADPAPGTASRNGADPAAGTAAGALPDATSGPGAGAAAVSSAPGMARRPGASPGPPPPGMDV